MFVVSFIIFAKYNMESEGEDDYLFGDNYETKNEK